MLIYYFYISLFFPAFNSSITIVDDSETTDASSREDINTGDASLTTALAEKTRITAKQADIKPTTIVNITTAVEEVTNKSTMNSSGKSETTSTVKGSYPNLILTTFIFINLICSLFFGIPEIISTETCS
jgi:Flp pilus assembly protein TadG